MLQKDCIYCGLTSFGSSIDEWICPYCKKDITELSSKIAETDAKELDKL